MNAQRKPTLVDVARQAQVAPSVVSRLLNSDPSLRIRPETRSRVLEVVDSLGYAPNHAGRALRSARIGVLALIIPELTNPVYADMRQGAEAAAREAGYLMFLANGDEVESHPDFYQRLVSERRIDGILLQRSSLIDDEAFRRLANTELPTVFINSRIEGTCGSVILDDEAGMESAVNHLLSLGHHDIGLLAGPSSVDWAGRRRVGFVNALARAGIAPRPEWLVPGGYDTNTGRAGMELLLQNASLPTAAVVANVIAAIGALAAARERGVEVPRDLSLVAFHDTWFAAHTSPPLTAVKLPLYELGSRAVSLLLGRMAGGVPSDERVLSPVPELVLRGSTGTPRSAG